MPKYMVLVSGKLGGVGDLVELTETEATQLDQEAGFKVVEKFKDSFTYNLPVQGHDPIEQVLALAGYGLERVADERRKLAQSEVEKLEFKRLPKLFPVESAEEQKKKEEKPIDSMLSLPTNVQKALDDRDQAREDAKFKSAEHVADALAKEKARKEALSTAEVKVETDTVEDLGDEADTSGADSDEGAEKTDAEQDAGVESEPKKTPGRQRRAKCD